MHIKCFHTHCTENPILPGQKYLFSVDFLSMNYHIFKDLQTNSFVSNCVGIAATEKINARLLMDLCNLYHKLEI